MMTEQILPTEFQIDSEHLLPTLSWNDLQFVLEYLAVDQTRRLEVPGLIQEMMSTKDLTPRALLLSLLTMGNIISDPRVTFSPLRLMRGEARVN